MAANDNPQQTVLYLIGGSTVVVLLARTISDPKSTLREPGGMLRIVIGGSIVAYVCFFVAKPAPKLATGLAGLVLVGTMMTYIAPVADKLGQVLSSKKEYITPDVVSKKKATKVPRKGPVGGGINGLPYEIPEPDADQSAPDSSGNGGGGGGGGSWE